MTTKTEEEVEKKYWATGRRKASVARVRMLPEGSGQVTVNGLPVDKYFTTEQARIDVVSALRLCKMEKKFDLKIRVHGGGITGQSQAIRMGVARALLLFDPELRSTLRPKGFLTRDARKVERKKYGHPKARKSFQFSKR